MEIFADRLVAAVHKKSSPCVVGLDPRIDLMPEFVKSGRGVHSRAARESGVGHNVYGERGHVRRSDHASDGKRGAKLVATFFELIAQQFRGQRRVHESRGDEVDSHGRDFKR